jgi:hypothetical protein
MTQRTELKKIVEVRGRFRGTFARMGSKHAYRGPDLPTVLLQTIIEVQTGRVVSDHLWMNYTEGFKAIAPLVEGDVIEFEARVKPYEKGYKGRREEVWKPVTIDYKLSHPTRIRKVSGEVKEDNTGQLALLL